MKKEIVTFLMVSVFYLLGSAQVELGKMDVSLSHNWMSYGRDIEIGVDKYLYKGVLHVGLNIFQRDAINKLYYSSPSKTFSADNFVQSLGLNLGYKICLKLKDSPTELLPAFNTKVFYLNTIQKVNWGTGQETLSQFSAHLIIYNSLGFDAKLNIAKNYFLIGGIKGTLLLEDRSNQNIVSLDSIGNFNWEMGGLFSLGLIYRIKQ